MVLINNRRGEIEILSDILEMARDGAKKTELLYQVNLSYSQLQKYLSFLITKGLLEEKELASRGNHRLYTVSDKGIELLENLNQIRSILK